jgi:hypothetical protein
MAREPFAGARHALAISVFAISVWAGVKCAKELLCPFVSYQELLPLPVGVLRSLKKVKFPADLTRVDQLRERRDRMVQPFNILDERIPTILPKGVSKGSSYCVLVQVTQRAGLEFEDLGVQCSQSFFKVVFKRD